VPPASTPATTGLAPTATPGPDAAPATPEWVTGLLGPGAALVEDIAGGSSRRTVLVALAGGGRVVARHDRGGGPLTGTPFGLAREAATYVAVARGARGVPVPAVRAVAPDGTAFAADHVPGAPSRGAEALDDYLATLGRLHAAGLAARPPAELGLPGFDDAGADDLGLWARIAAERVRRPAPLVAAALDALRRHGAAAPPDVVVCHGDAGAGNYLHRGDTVTGLVDWEMAHTGDPHDDLASVAVRAVLAGSGADVGDLPARIAGSYTPVSGVAFDPGRHLVGVTATLTRMVVSCLAALDQADPGQDTTVQLLGLPLMEWHLVRALARLDGRPAPVLDLAATPPDPAYAAEVAAVVAAGLRRDVLPLVRGGPAEPTVRRLRYAATQLAVALPGLAAPPPGPGPGPGPGPAAAEPTWDGLVAAAASRVAVVPASAPIAAAPVPGVA
jgi:aminoglycoside phosphotransferase (APT) family kinase protein